MRSRCHGEECPVFAVESSVLDPSVPPVWFLVRRFLIQIHSAPMAMPRKVIPLRTALIILTRGGLPWLEDNIDVANDEVSDDVSDGVSDGVSD